MFVSAESITRFENQVSLIFNYDSKVEMRRTRSADWQKLMGSNTSFIKLKCLLVPVL